MTEVAKNETKKRYISLFSTNSFKADESLEKPSASSPDVKTAIFSWMPLT
jgi:hypothetical protein